MARQHKGGKPGMPLALTPDMHKLLVSYIAAGNTVNFASRACGITRETFYQWRRKSRRGLEPYATLFRDVDKAVARAVVRNVTIVAKAAETNFRAATWWLERTVPQVYGRRDRVELTGAKGAPLAPTLDLSKLTDDQLRKLRNGESIDAKEQPDAKPKRRHPAPEDD
jgi:transposase-like protein